MNYSFDTYGDDSGFGGGFMGATQLDNIANSQSQATPQKGGRSQQSLMPITINQLKGATRDQPDDVFRLDGKELKNVRVIGMIMGVSQHSTHLTITLNDTTAQTEVKMFLHGDDTESPFTDPSKSLREGIYVVAFGSLRSYQDQMNLTCYSIRPIEDFNEITHHYLECIFAHLQNTRGPIKRENAVGAPTTPVKSSRNQQQMYQTPTQQFQGMGMNSNNFMDIGSNFTPDQQMVLQALDQATSDTGLSIDHLLQQLRGHLQENQVRNALTYLTNEGHVYSTIDENHFKKTE